MFNDIASNMISLNIKIDKVMKEIRDTKLENAKLKEIINNQENKISPIENQEAKIL